MALVQGPMPARNPMIDPRSGLISRPWQKWLRSRADIVNVTPTRVGSVSLSGQAASISPAQPVPIVVVPGLYRVSVLAYRTTLASASSALGVIIWFKAGTALQSVATPVNNINELDEVVSGSWLIRCAPDSSISYEVSYGSVNAGEMKYSLDIIVEQVQV